ncbi:MAG: hypothetical protein ABR567_16200 [Myxococcales bacterium]
MNTNAHKPPPPPPEPVCRKCLLPIRWNPDVPTARVCICPRICFGPWDFD